SRVPARTAGGPRRRRPVGDPGPGHGLAPPARRIDGRRAARGPRGTLRAARRHGAGRLAAAMTRTADNRGMEIELLTPQQALARMRAGAVLVDVREAHERELGMAEGALGIARGDLESAPADALPDTDAEVLLICQAGGRSLQAARALCAAGYRRIASVEGGTRRWQAEALPMCMPAGDADFMERYSRHLRLPNVGLAGQQRLEASTVLLLGAGGLGSPAAYYLAAAGVGRLR